MKLLRVRICTAPLLDISKVSTGFATIRVPDDYDPTSYTFGIQGFEVFAPVLPTDTKPTTTTTESVTHRRGRGRPPKGQPTWLQLIQQTMGTKKMTSTAIREALASHGVSPRTVAQIMSKNSKGRSSLFKRVGRGTYVVR